MREAAVPVSVVARLVNLSLRRTVLVAFVVLNILGGESSPVGRTMLTTTNQAKRTKFGLGSTPNLHFLHEQQVRRKDHDGDHSRHLLSQENSDYEHQVAEYHRRQYLHHLEQYERRLPQTQHLKSSLDRRMPNRYPTLTPVSLSALATELPVIPTSNERLLNCSSFPCLLSKYEMIKTDKGYILNRDESNRDLIQDSNPSTDPSCDGGFRRWISKFRIGKKGYGFELVLKELQSGLSSLSSSSLTPSSWSSASSLGASSGPSSSSTPDGDHRFRELRPEDVFSFGHLDRESSRDLGHSKDASHLDRGSLRDLGHPKDADRAKDTKHEMGLISSHLHQQEKSGDKSSSAQDDSNDDYFYDYFGLIDGDRKKKRVV